MDDGLIPLDDDLLGHLKDAVERNLAERAKHDFYAPEQEEAMRERLKRQRIMVDNISGACPIQAEGYIDNHPFYFRARGDMWQIGLAAPGQTHDDAVMMTIVDELPPGCWYYDEDYGDGPYDAGWMPVREALGFIEQAAIRFRARG